MNTVQRLEMSALNGALIWRGSNWLWRDGTPEPRVRPMTLRDVAPNFRVMGGMVEVPKSWRDARHWPAEPVDSDAMRAIENLLTRAPAEMIYHEGVAEKLNNHELRQPGYRVPVSEWDAVMGAVIGCWWDKADEAAILERAQQVAAKVFSIIEAAAALKVNPSRVRQLIRAGRIAAVKRGRDWDVPEAEVRRYMRERHKAGRPRRE